MKPPLHSWMSIRSAMDAREQSSGGGIFDVAGRSPLVEKRHRCVTNGRSEVAGRRRRSCLDAAAFLRSFADRRASADRPRQRYRQAVGMAPPAVGGTAAGGMARLAVEVTAAGWVAREGSRRSGRAVLLGGRDQLGVVGAQLRFGQPA